MNVNAEEYMKWKAAAIALDGMTARNALLLDEVKALRERLEQKDKEGPLTDGVVDIAMLQSQLAGTQMANEVLRRQNRDHREERGKLQNQILELQNYVNARQFEEAKQIEATKLLNDRVQRLNSRLCEVLEESIAKGERIKALESSLAEKTEALAACEVHNKAYGERCRQLQNDMMNNGTAYDSLKLDNARLQSDMRDLDLALRTARTELSNTRRVHQENLQRNQSLVVLSASLRTSNRDLESQVRDLRERNAALLANKADILAAQISRSRDLLRQARFYLHDEGLLSDEEYTALANEQGGPERLEAYDGARRRLAQIEHYVKTMWHDHPDSGHPHDGQQACRWCVIKECILAQTRPPITADATGGSDDNGSAGGGTEADTGTGTPVGI